MDLSIGIIAKRVGCKVPTIRYYEQIGLLTKPYRTNGNQRRYDESHLQQLGFICHAREFGFSIDSIKQLLHMNEGFIASGISSCHDADEIAIQHLDAIERKIVRLQLLRDEMKRMLSACKKGQSHDCQVLSVLSDHDLCQHDH